MDSPRPAIVVVQQPSPPDRLILVADFPVQPPDELFACWTVPAQVCRWWPQQAEIEPRAGGIYHFAWPAMGWHLRGHYTVFAPGQALGFTWHWDHDTPEHPARTVDLHFTSISGGTRLTLTHGTYTDSPADQEERIAHHLAGWQHFLPRLALLAAPE